MRGMDRTCLPDRLMLSHPPAPHVNYLHHPSLQLPNISRLSFESLLWTQICGFNQIELLVAYTLEQNRPARHDSKATDDNNKNNKNNNGLQTQIQAYRQARKARSKNQRRLLPPTPQLAPKHHLPHRTNLHHLRTPLPSPPNPLPLLLPVHLALDPLLLPLPLPHQPQRPNPPHHTPTHSPSPWPARPLRNPTSPPLPIHPLIPRPSAHQFPLRQRRFQRLRFEFRSRIGSEY